MDQLEDMHPSSSEYYKKKQEYVSSPFAPFQSENISLYLLIKTRAHPPNKQFLCDSGRHHNIVFGHEEAKKIVRLLAQWISNPIVKAW
jgi:hypothetical protein